MFRDKKIIIAGGSGFIGQHMIKRWSAGNDIIILTRRRKSHDNRYGQVNAGSQATYISWDGENVGDWGTALDGSDLLINLAGRSVNCRYNAANKAKIFSSRLNSTRALGNAVLQCKTAPRLWINGGSATIYPHATTMARDEDFGDFADDFSVQVCKAWENCFQDFKLPSTRQVILRMAIVLGEGGVMVPFKRLARLGLGGAQGSGRQMFSWIHEEDLCRIVEWLWDHKDQQGIFNASAPGPVPNTVFMAALRRAMSISFGLQSPEWMLKAGAALIGTEPELLLKSRWVLPRRLMDNGFCFRYPDIDQAMKALMRSSNSKE